MLESIVQEHRLGKTKPLLLTGGGPGNSTTFLSMFVARKAESYELGYAGAVSVIYLYIVIVLSYLFFQVATHSKKDQTI